MRTNLLAKALLAVVFATVSYTATADPIVCNPLGTIVPPGTQTGLQGFIERLVGGSEKPQAFTGAVIDEPDPCSLGLDTRPVAAEPKRRARREAIN